MSLYLVTGGCGFIGSTLADALLAAGHQVRILDNLSSGRVANRPARAELTIGDVADPNCVLEAMADADGCFHLAAVASVELSRHDWLGTHRSNLTGSITVFDAARQARPHRPVPVVYASSAAVYGDVGTAPIGESHPLRPLSAYGADKLGSELHAAVAARVHGVPTCGLRFFNVYGPRQDPASPYSGVISIFCDRISSNRPVTIFGDGAQTRDFVFVEDVVRTLMAAMAHASLEAQVFNVCSGRGVSVIELAHAIAEIAGARGRLLFKDGRPGEIRHSVGDPTLAKETLGVAAATPLGTGLERTLAALAATARRGVRAPADVTGEGAYAARPGESMPAVRAPG